MVDGQYVFGDVNNCDRKVIPDVHIMVGLGNEKYGSSKGSGLAFGAGGGVVTKITKKIGVRAQVDFLGIKFKDTDELNKNYRASIGVVFR